MAWAILGAIVGAAGALALVPFMYPLASPVSHTLQLRPLAIGPTVGSPVRPPQETARLTPATRLSPGSPQLVPLVADRAATALVDRAPAAAMGAPSSGVSLGTLYALMSLGGVFAAALALLYPAKSNPPASAEALPNDPLGVAWLALPQVALIAMSGDVVEGPDAAGATEVGPRCDVDLSFAKPFAEGTRPLVDYVQLPAKSYSLLDSKQVQRIDDDTFRVAFGDMKVPGLLRVSPSATVTVEVPDDGAVQTIRSVVFEGKPKRLIDALNMMFEKMTWVNEISATPAEEPGYSNLVSRVQLDWTLPKQFAVKPTLMTTLVTRLMNYMMPWLLNKLEADYARWAEGDDTRSAVSKGEIAELTATFFKQNQDLVGQPMAASAAPAPAPGNGEEGKGEKA